MILLVSVSFLFVFNKFFDDFDDDDEGDGDDDGDSDDDDHGENGDKCDKKENLIKSQFNLTCTQRKPWQIPAMVAY